MFNWVIQMKRILCFLLIFLFCTLGLPYLIICQFQEQKSAENGEPYPTVLVYLKDENRTEEMNTSQYLKEVVAAEMPAQFHEEALKAQAVAARTYLVNRVRVSRSSGSAEEHHGADICTDSTHCKAWIREEKRRELWGSDADANWKKISDAVDSTAGVLITYQNEPISAVFHSTSSGRTENAKDVWGGDVPYLVSVPSEGEELSPRYHSERVLTIEEFQQIAQEKLSGLDWNKGLIGEITRSDAGGILTIEIGGVPIKGTEFRSLYELRSTHVDAQVTEDSVILSVTGFGHGVGMSQYGANYLASTGKNYEEILKYYYTGVNVGKKGM